MSDFIDGHANVNLYIKPTQSLGKYNQTDPSAKTIYPAIIYRKNNITMNNVPGIDMTQHFDPALAAYKNKIEQLQDETTTSKLTTTEIPRTHHVTIPKPISQRQREAFAQAHSDNFPVEHFRHGSKLYFNHNIGSTSEAVVEHYTETPANKELNLDATDKHALDTYLEALKARAKAVCEYCMTAPAYKPWAHNWQLLHDNLFKKNKLVFNLLDHSDQDIAYVINKGTKVCFRLHDSKRAVPINIYQYVLYHEMAHMSTEELQHTKTFHMLLNLLSTAAYELCFIDLKKVTTNVYTTNGQGIASAESLQDEIILGCNCMIQAHANNPDLKQYYTDLRTHVAGRV